MEKQKSLWPRIIATLIGVPLLYVASFGPACWWLSRRRLHPDANVTTDCLGLVYVPCGRLAIFGPSVISDPLVWYASVGIPAGRGYVIPIGWRRWAVPTL